MLLAFDPGPFHCAMATCVRNGARVEVIATEMVESDVGPLHLKMLQRGIEAIAVEVPAYAFSSMPSMLMHLLETRAVAERIKTVAHFVVPSARIVETTSTEWREALCGKRNAKDAEVEQHLRPLVDGFPRPMTTKNHERDAIGVAAFAAMKIAGCSSVSKIRAAGVR